MARSLTRLDELGYTVAAALECAAAERRRALEEARREFLVRDPRPGLADSWRSASAQWSMAAVLLLSALVLVFAARRSVPIYFAVNGVAGAEKTWLAAPIAAPLSLAFSEGTRVTLLAASRGEVAAIDPHGASLVLEHGGLHAEVVHKPGAAWDVAAGPFTVTVTGTVFDVNWEPKSGQLSVSVTRGSVVVRDTITGAGQAVRASESLRSSALEHRLELMRAGSALAAAPSASAFSATAEAAHSAPPPEFNVGARHGAANAPTARVGVSAVRSHAASLASRRADATAQAWRELAARGALREAFGSAEGSGFTQACALASPGELLLLGDGARLSGNSDRALEALLTLRRRYPSDPRRAAAAFSLGKVAFDQRHAYEDAMRWFSTSLREQPNGPLAREASGRLIEASRRAGDGAAAQSAARAYLAQYPGGPHAELALSLVP